VAAPSWFFPMHSDDWLCPWLKIRINSMQNQRLQNLIFSETKKQNVYRITSFCRETTVNSFDE
jgi:hypothetical protein